ncbi:efflux RND transporter periplasmic adaptor subunit [Magnetospirillum molischianum]|uniref:Membrane-fusion protein n=1 Tax=Magnetospirillum molischianum DSM 120 TaxID=1150626 RepID=H8FXL3_MAGML|nr:efflux RND transporter periplasmic adaptor subunit [Magnetospirillum molischianum]CCG43101.1 Membrane-fusion protein [Magnetospirillum molischianum DSM 120]
MSLHQPNNRTAFRRLAIVFAVLAGLGLAAYFLFPGLKSGTLSSGGSGAATAKGGPGGPGGPEGRPVPVLTASVSRRDVPLYLDALGTVQAFNTVTVRSQVDGELIEVLFREGQDVKAGDVLAQIDPRTYRAAYEQAQATRDKDQAQLDAARRDLARYVALGDRVTGQSVDTQRAQVRQLEAAVRADEAAISSARIQLSHTVIAAPIDGRVGIRQVDRGNIVHASDTTGLVNLTQVQPISVIFTLPQQNLNAINERMAQGNRLTVLATQSDGKGVIDTGELELVDNQIDQTTGTIKLKAVLPNAERRLWPGGFVTVRLLLAVRHDGLVVPLPSVQRGPQGPYVFRVTPEKTVEMRSVTIGAIESEQALIESGLEEGDVVVTDGVAKLKPGSKISLPEDRAKARDAAAAASTSFPIPPAPAPAGAQSR